MSTLMQWLARLYAPLNARGALIAGLPIHAPSAPGTSESRTADTARTPFAQPRSRTRAARHAHESRSTLAA